MDRLSHPDGFSAEELRNPLLEKASVQALDTLPETHRVVLCLKLSYHFTHEEIFPRCSESPWARVEEPPEHRVHADEGGRPHQPQAVGASCRFPRVGRTVSTSTLGPRPGRRGSISRPSAEHSGKEEQDSKHAPDLEAHASIRGAVVHRMSDYKTETCPFDGLRLPELEPPKEFKEHIFRAVAEELVKDASTPQPPALKLVPTPSVAEPRRSPGRGQTQDRKTNRPTYEGAQSETGGTCFYSPHVRASCSRSSRG